MVSEWETVLLGDQVELLTGFPFKSKQYTEDSDGIKLVRGDNVVQGHLRWDGVKRWPVELLNGLENYLLATGDVVLAMDRPWIEAGLKYSELTSHDLPALLVQRVSRLRGKKHLQTRFLKYLIGSPYFTNHVLAVQTGTAVPHISGSQIKEFVFKLPPLPEQKSIAHILGSLDDKIELNRRMNATLEGMAQALFKSWFVDFDPVIDNALEAGNPIPEELSKRAEVRRKALADGTANRDVAKQFPDAFQLTEEMGWIPKDWEVESIYKLISVIYGAPFTSSLFLSDGKGVPVIRIRDLKTGTPQNWTTEDHPKKTLIKTGDVVVGMDAEFRATIWPGDSGYLNQRLFLADPKEDYVNKFFIQHTLCPQLEFEENTQVGTTVSHLGKKEIDKFITLNPTKDLIVEYSKITTPLLDRLVSNHNSLKSLSKLRDTLLPKLISGELRIPEAGKLAEEAIEQEPREVTDV